MDTSLWTALFGGSAAPRTPNEPVWIGRPRDGRRGVAVAVTVRPAHFRGLSRKAYRLITKQQRRDAIDVKQHENTIAAAMRRAG